MLNDTQIHQHLEAGSIVIRPFDPQSLGTNSYDVHLGETLAVYTDTELDIKKEPSVHYFKIPKEGFVLEPGKFYLGVTQEYTETHQHVPFLEGKSSLARLGLCIHLAPAGNVGFCNHWTLEISCMIPIRIYAGMSIAQLFYFEIDNQSIEHKYHQKLSAKYNEISSVPQKSMTWKNFS